MTLDNLLSELSSSQATSNILSPLFPMFWAPQKKWSPLYCGEWKSVRIGYLQFWGTWNKKYLYLYSYVHTRLKISRMSFYRILVSLCLLKKCPQTCFIQATQNRFSSQKNLFFQSCLQSAALCWYTTQQIVTIQEWMKMIPKENYTNGKY